MMWQGVCTERVIAMCVLCPAQASLNWSAHIIRVSDRYIKVQWLEIACILLSGDTHVLPFYVCVSGRVDSSVSCSAPPPDLPVPWGSVGLLCLSLYSIEMKEGGRSIRDLCRAYIHKHIRTAWVWWHAVGCGPALQAGRSWVRIPYLGGRGFVCPIWKVVGSYAV